MDNVPNTGRTNNPTNDPYIYNDSDNTIVDPLTGDPVVVVSFEELGNPDDDPTIVPVRRNGDRVELPEGDSARPEVLALFAEAMAAVFSAMNEGLISQIEQFVDVQKLSKQMSQEVLRSTELSINKQQEEKVKIKKINEKLEAAAKRHKILSWITIGVIALLLIATLLASGGSTAPVAVAAAEGVAADATVSLTVGGVVSATVKAGALALGIYNAVQAAKSGNKDEMGLAIAIVIMGALLFAAPYISSALGTGVSAASDLASAAEGAENSNIDWEKVAQKIFQTGAAAILTADQIQMAATNFSVSKMKDELADIQENVGKALAVLAANNALYKLFQQIMQRESELLDRESQNSTDAMSTAGDVFRGYRQITTGLSQAV